MMGRALLTEILLVEGADAIYGLMCDANVHWLDSMVTPPRERVGR